MQYQYLTVNPSQLTANSCLRGASQTMGPFQQWIVTLGDAWSKVKDASGRQAGQLVQLNQCVWLMMPASSMPQFMFWIWFALIIYSMNRAWSKRDVKRFWCAGAWLKPEAGWNITACY